MKPLKIDKYLNNIAQELYKTIIKKNEEVNPILMNIISVNLGFYCSENEIEYKIAREILEKIENFIEQLKLLSETDISIDEVRKELLRICNSRSAQEVFFYDRLRPYGVILYQDDNEDKIIRKTIWKLDGKYWITIQEKGDLKVLKEINEFNESE